jgi:hypothetical protein
MLPNNPLPLNWDRLQFNACNGLEVGLGEGNPHFVVNNCNLNHVIFFSRIEEPKWYSILNARNKKQVYSKCVNKHATLLL